MSEKLFKLVEPGNDQPIYGFDRMPVENPYIGAYGALLKGQKPLHDLEIGEGSLKRYALSGQKPTVYKIVRVQLASVPAIRASHGRRTARRERTMSKIIYNLSDAAKRAEPAAGGPGGFKVLVRTPDGEREFEPRADGKPIARTREQAQLIADYATETARMRGWRFSYRVVPAQRAVGGVSS